MSIYDYSPYVFGNPWTGSPNGRPNKSDALAELAEAFKPQPTEVEKLKKENALLQRQLENSADTIAFNLNRINTLTDERDKARAALKKSESDLQAKSQAYASCATDRDQKARDYNAKCDEVNKLKKNLANATRGPVDHGMDQVSLLSWYGVRAERDALQRRLDEAQAAIGGLNKVRAERDKLKEENDTLKSSGIGRLPRGKSVTWAQIKRVEITMESGVTYQAVGPKALTVTF